MKYISSILFCLLTFQAHSLPNKPLPLNIPIQTGVKQQPIAGWLEFCKNYQSECLFDNSEPKKLILDERLWNLISRVNANINSQIKPITDMDHWGVSDRWNLAEDGMGDCEDYQLLKRKKLADAGVPRRAMRMTVVLDSKKEGHAVLMIRTNRGDYVLDNITDEILSWDQTGYMFYKQESQENPTEWVKLNSYDVTVVSYFKK